jgi:hypothetical protein
MQHMWNDGICDPECNNLACDHNDCTAQQIIDKCIDEQDRTGIGFSGPPSDSLVPMNMQLDLAQVASTWNMRASLPPAILGFQASPILCSQARLEIRTEINEMVLQQEIIFVLQWQDSRLKLSPCKAVLTDLLSMSREAANSDLQRNIKAAYQARFWLPKVQATNLVPGYYAFVDELAYMLEDNGVWQEGFAGPNMTAGAGVHARRRAAANVVQAQRLTTARAAADPGEANAVLRAARHAARVKGGNWRADEQRQLRESTGRRLDELPEEVACEDCSMMMGEIEFQILQGFKYTYFPFDEHVITMQVILAGADLFTCRERDGLSIMGLTQENAQSLLLPSTGTWQLNGPLEEAVTLAHPTDPLTDEPAREMCVLEVRIRRNWAVYFVKSICTLLLVTMGGLVALLMQPAELMEGRCAQLLVAILIIITALQMDLGLGNLSYLIWVDYFNLMQLVILLLALAQTMALHRLDHAKMNDFVVIFDRVFRVLMPLLLYPSLVIGTICLGMRMDIAGILILVFGCGGFFGIGAFAIYRTHVRVQVDRAKALKAARSLTPETDDGIYLQVVTNLFEKFDLDGGGEMDLAETRNMLEKQFPKANRTAIRAAMLVVHKYAGSDESLDLATFLDAYGEAADILKEAEKANKTLMDHAHAAVNSLGRCASVGDPAETLMEVEGNAMEGKPKRGIFSVRSTSSTKDLLRRCKGGCEANIQQATPKPSPSSITEDVTHSVSYA